MAIEYHSNFICIQCHDRNSLDIDSTYSTLLPFSDLDNLDEIFGANLDYSPFVTKKIPDPDDHWSSFNKKGLHLLHLNVNSLLPMQIDEVKYRFSRG